PWTDLATSINSSFVNSSLANIKSTPLYVHSILSSAKAPIVNPKLTMSPSASFGCDDVGTDFNFSCTNVKSFSPVNVRMTRLPSSRLISFFSSSSAPAASSGNVTSNVSSPSLSFDAATSSLSSSIQSSIEKSSSLKAGSISNCVKFTST